MVDNISNRCFNCVVCGNGYSDADQLEIHLRKEHTKTDFIAYFRAEEVKHVRSKEAN